MGISPRPPFLFSYEAVTGNPPRTTHSRSSFTNLTHIARIGVNLRGTATSRGGTG